MNTVTVFVACPVCDDEVPIVVTVGVVTCDCGDGHQALTFTQDMIEVEAHVLLHEESL